MKTLYKILISMLFAFALCSNLFAQDSTKVVKNPKNVQNNNQAIQHGGGFVDLNGDGYNDNAPDHDGDGIPNGLDKDYIKFKRNGQGQGQGRRMRFIDLDGDGINDNAGKGFGRGMNRNMRFNNNSTLPLNNNNAAGTTQQTSGNTNGNKNQKRGNK